MKTKFQRGDHVVNITHGTDTYRQSFVVELAYIAQGGHERICLVGQDNSGRYGALTGKAATYYERLSVLKAQAAARAELRRMTGRES